MNETINNLSGSIVVTVDGVVVSAKPNVITNLASTVLADIMAGSTWLTPKYIGFIYAKKTVPSFPRPEDLLPDKREHTLTSIRSTVAAETGNMLICPVQSVNNVKATATYTAAMSGNELAFAGSDVASALPSEADAVYQIVLLSKNNNGEYIPFAYTSMKPDGSGINMINGAEMITSWSVTFA